MKNTLDLVRMLGEVASIANESDATAEAVARSLGHLCRAGGWDLGHAYLREEDGGYLRSTGIWQGRGSWPGLREFRQVSESVRIEPGQGWVGRIYASGRPLWLDDVSRDPDFRRSAPAGAAGLRTALGFPVVMDSRVIGVIELFARTLRRPEPRITELAVHLGEILGTVFEREESRRDLTSARRRFEALFSLLPVPAVVASLPDGRYVEVNRRFEETFGHARGEVLGRTTLDVGLWADPGQGLDFLKQIPPAPDYVASEVTLLGREGRSIKGIVTVTRIVWDNVPHVLVMMLDVSDLVEAQRLLQRRHKEVGVLVERLLDVQEEERSRISRELHDRIGQTLTAIKLKVAELEGADPDARRRHVAETLAMVDEALEDARTLSFDLRPAMLDELGLANAVRAYAVRQAAGAGLDITLKVPEMLPEVGADVQTACYRILQEAVTNAIRHAGASHLDVEVAVTGPELLLRVEDDGVGFCTEDSATHLGLLIMRERADLVGGDVEVSSSPGVGTVVTARFPHRPEGPR